MDKATILFVDDEMHILNAMNWLFRKQYKVLLANSGEEAIALMKKHKIDVVCSDQKMPGMTGVEVLSNAKQIIPGAIRILLTGYSDFKAVVGSVNEGEIFRYIQKPWDNSKFRDSIAEAVHISKETATSIKTQPEIDTEKTQEISLLVLDRDNAVTKDIADIISTSHPVHIASDMSEAIDSLEKNNIGVLISDVKVGNTDVTTLVKALKNYHPEIVSIVVTDQADTNTVVDLINEGQIYRFLAKPLKKGSCKINVESAVRKHIQLSQNPDLRIRHIVDKNSFIKKLGGVEEMKLIAGADNLNDQEISQSHTGFFATLLGRLKNLNNTLVRH